MSIEIKQISKLKYKDYDASIMISRYNKYKSEKMIYLEELGPPPDVYKEARELMNMGAWNDKTFLSTYAPKYLNYIKHSDLAKKRLIQLTELGRSAKICICCFCTTEHLCHRSIVAGLLKGLAPDVEVIQHENNYDYSIYPTMYANLDGDDNKK